MRDRLLEGPGTLLLAMALGAGCAARQAETRPALAVPSPAPVAATPAPETEAGAASPTPAPPPVSSFQASVRPILARRCDPCHNPGGRMYERLPFDDPSTVASHRDGVLRRLKDAEEQETVRRWIQEQSSNP